MRCLLATAGVVWTVASWSASPPIDSVVEWDRLRGNERRWNSQHIASYRFTVVPSCIPACPPDSGLPIRVTVVDDRITTAVYARAGVTIRAGDPVPRDAWDWRWLRTISDTFEWIRSLFGEHAGWVKVEYDFELGFPRSIVIYAPEDMPDGGGGFRYTDFENLVTPNSTSEKTREDNT